MRLARALATRTARRGGLLDWTVNNRVWLKPELLLDMTKHAYLRDIYQDAARELVLYKASQLGASEYLVSYALWSADRRNATVLYVFPTDTHVSDFSTARFGPAIEASPYLSSIISEGVVDGEGRRRRTDRVTLKRVRNRYIYFRGAKVDPDGRAAQLKSVDADVLILDELAEMDARAPDIAVKRLGHSELKEVRWVSTPTYPGANIHVKWQESDQREWMVRCGSCGSWQDLRIYDVVTEWDDLDRPVAWHGQREDRAWAACRRCGAELDRLGAGRWVPAALGRDLHGYHLTKLFSHTNELLPIVLGLDTVDETKRKETTNQDLGEPYTPRGGQLTEETLDACRREYRHGPVQGERTFAGIDVGKLINVVIRTVDIDRETGERPQRLAVAVEGFDEVARLLRRYNVQACVIDALPETRKARELQASFRAGVVWLAYFVTQKSGLKTEDTVQVKEAEWTVSIDRTRAFDEMFAGVLDASVGRGGLTLPVSIRAVNDYYSQMIAQVRVLERAADGNMVAVYRESGPDHYSLAELYCHVAGSVPRAASLPSQSKLMKKSGWR